MASPRVHHGDASLASSQGHIRSPSPPSPPPPATISIRVAASMADKRLSFFEAEGGHEATVIKSIVFACDLKPLSGFHDLTEDSKGRIVKPADNREKKVQ